VSDLEKKHDLECTDNPRTTAVDRRSTPSARVDRQALLP
jgi:hypothetical protein